MALGPAHNGSNITKLTAFMALLVLGCLAFSRAALAEDPIVIDGDRIRLGATTIRLYGIDAPEPDQICRRNGADWHCGRDAAAFLRGLIDQKPITCEAKGKDIYGQIAAVCSVGQLDINREMVRAGFAWAETYYARDYEDSESEAAYMRRGVWGSEAERAWIWREQQRGKRRR